MESKNVLKIILSILGYVIDANIVVFAFLCDGVVLPVLLCYVAVVVITCVIVKLVKQDKIADNMAIFVGKWSFYISTFVLALIVELILFIFGINFIDSVLKKIEK